MPASPGTTVTMVTGTDGARFEPLVVLEFAMNVKQAAIEWMMAKLQAPPERNGADLCVSAMVMQHNQVGGVGGVGGVGVFF